MSADTDAASRVRTPTILALLAALATGAALRGVGIDFGLDFDDPRGATFSHQNDELAMAMAVRDRLLRGDLHPGPFLHWGSGGFYAQGAVDALWLLVEQARGRPRSEVLAAWTDNISPMLRAHRLLSLVAGLLTILLTFRLAGRCLGRDAAGLAALLLATCYLHVRESHFGTLDVLQGLAGVFVLDRCVAWTRQPRRSHVRLAGAGIGVAAAIKYSSVLLVLPLVAVVAGASRDRRRWVELLVALALSAAVFLLLSPHVFFAFDDVREMLAKQSAVIGFRFESLLPVLWYHVSYTFGVGFGTITTLVAAVGWVLMLRAPSTRLPAIAMTLAFLSLITTRTTAVRYGAPLVPFLAVFVAAAIVAIVPPGSRRRGLKLALLLGWMAIPSLVRSVFFDRLLTRTDTRVEVQARLDPVVKVRDDVMIFGVYGLPDLAHLPFMRIAYDNPRYTVETASALRPPYLVELVADPVREYGFDVYWPGARDDYEVVLDLDPRVDGATPDLPDLRSGTPDFFVPFERPWATTRPGPPIRVYRRLD